MLILGISALYHESAASILKDGQILAASAEERFTRVKHDYSYPKNAIDFCLKFTKTSPEKLDYVVFYEKPLIKFERNLTLSLKYFPKSYSFFRDSMKNILTEKLWIKATISSHLKISPDKIIFIPHHLSHAAASFYPSPFKECAYLTLDGVGEWSTGSWGIASDNRLTPKFEINFPHSVGLLYSTFTSYLGFEVNDGEYKLMGMAGYGRPKYLDRVKKLYKQNKDSSIVLNLDYFAFYHSSKSMFSQKFIKEFENLDKFNLAASVQAVTEEIVFNMLNFIRHQTGQTNLVLGGGVALNSVLNSKITSNTSFKKVFIFPAAGDDGGAIGAALYAFHQLMGNKKRYQLKDVFLGPKLSKISGLGKKLSEKKLIHYISSKLAEGKVVGWFEGRAEFGPRALGHRSILADPRDSKMKDKVNSKIKFREEFRPFAPVVLSEYAKDYFENIQPNLSEYMLGTFKATKKCQKQAPAIVHIDKTSRVQTLDKNYPGRLRALLQNFNKKTRVPILLNTSFNLKGEPIVNSVEDAVSTFNRSDLDILVIENYVLEK